MLKKKKRGGKAALHLLLLLLFVFLKVVSSFIDHYASITKREYTYI